MRGVSNTPTAPDYATLKRAVRAYFRAVDDTSWHGGWCSPDGRPKNWHKRHDKEKAEAKLRRLVGA